VLTDYKCITPIDYMIDVYLNILYYPSQNNYSKGKYEISLKGLFTAGVRIDETTVLDEVE